MPVFSIGFDANAVRSGAGEASRALDGVTQSANKAEKSTKTLGNAFKSAAQAAVGLFGLYKLQNFGKEAVLGAARYETLGAAMIRAGENAGYSDNRCWNMKSSF
jgi:hypothetical protein